jgi:predicted DNA binding CopG/RHH family protein
MNKKIQNNLKDEKPLDDYEKELKRFLDERKFVRVKGNEAFKKELQESAKNFLELRKNKRITLRVNNMDLIKVKARAKRSNILYQRLLNALIHKYAEGDISLNV